MEIHTAYCSARDQQVRVITEPGWEQPDPPTAHDASAVICLAYGDTCTGAMCPLFAVPPARMKEWVERYREETGSGPDG